LPVGDYEGSRVYGNSGASSDKIDVKGRQILAFEHDQLALLQQAQVLGIHIQREFGDKFPWFH
jgi:hypothetical protein